jgi:hypothetical protein
VFVLDQGAPNLEKLGGQHRTGRQPLGSGCSLSLSPSFGDGCCGWVATQHLVARTEKEGWARGLRGPPKGLGKGRNVDTVLELQRGTEFNAHYQSGGQPNAIR